MTENTAAEAVAQAAVEAAAEAAATAATAAEAVAGTAAEVVDAANGAAAAANGAAAPARTARARAPRKTGNPQADRVARDATAAKATAKKTPAKPAAAKAPVAKAPVAKAPAKPKFTHEELAAKVPAGYELTWPHGQHSLLRRIGDGEGAAWLVLDNAHGTTTPAKNAKEGEALGTAARRAEWCRKCKTDAAKAAA